MKGFYLDVTSEQHTRSLCKANRISLVVVVKTGLSNTVASVLAQMSIRHMKNVIELWKKWLDQEDWSLIQFTT